MKRREFFKKLIGVGATLATVPIMAKANTKKDSFTIEDSFIQCDGNENLFYVRKDSELNRKLMEAIGDNYLPKNKFGCYYPVFGQYVPIKDEYTIEDFRQLIMFLEDKKNNSYYFCDGQMRDREVGLVRLNKDRSGKFYKMDLFQAFRISQYGPE